MIFSLLFTKFSTVFFAAACSQQQIQDLYGKRFFFFEPWWKYLGSKTDALGNCIPNVNLVDHPTNLWLIGLAILDMLLRLAGFLAVISIIVAGIELVRSEGSTEKATNARQRLVNSLVGLAVAAGATALVAFVGNTVGGANGSLPHTLANQKAIDRVLSAIFVIAGALAVLFIIIAGLRMVTSGDNPTKVSESRRQILYAALGLVVIALAATIVNFVLDRLG
jgi:type IV secretory pathway VirB2 component (pilin)